MDEPMAFGPLGIEWIVDAMRCSASALRDTAKIGGLIAQIVERLSLHPLSAPIVHTFPGEGGITALVLLAESHLTIHTFPELGSASVNLYCCRPRPVLEWKSVLGEWLEAGEVHVRSLARGTVTGAH
jgi:S-adenosylmethionine decarboxylase